MHGDPLALHYTGKEGSITFSYFLAHLQKRGQPNFFPKNSHWSELCRF